MKAKVSNPKKKTSKSTFAFKFWESLTRNEKVFIELLLHILYVETKKNKDVELNFGKNEIITLHKIEGKSKLLFRD